MGIKMGWYVPGRVAYIRWTGELTWELLQEANQAMSQYLDAGTPPVHLVTDVLEVTSFPVSLIKVKDLVTLRAHPALGWTVIVTSNPMLRFIATTVPKVARHSRTTAVASVTEAFKYLVERDETVDWSQADETVLEQDSESR